MAGQHRQRLDEGGGRRRFDQVGEHEHERALGALQGVKGAFVVAVERHRLEVVEELDELAGAAAARGELTPHLGVEGERAGTVTERLGHRRHRDRRVQRQIEPRRRADRGCAEAPAVEQTDDVLVALEPELVGDRPSMACGGEPVDLANVVVGGVLAQGLEVRPEPERSACPTPLVAEATLSDARREPARARKVGVDAQLELRAHGVRPLAEPERAAHPHRRGRERVTPPPPRGQRRLEAGIGLARHEAQIGADRLPQANRAAQRARRLELEPRCLAPHEDGGRDPAQRRSASDEESIDERCSREGAEGEQREPGGEEGRRHRERDGGEGGAACRAHRGTARPRSTVAIASSAR